MKTGLSFRGFFRMEAFKANGERRVLADWFPNTVLNTGLNQMGKGSGWAGAGSWCHIGTNGADPLPTQTGLETWAYSTSQQEAQSDGAQGSAPWYGWNRTTYRFPIGTFPGGVNIAEVGAGWGATNTEVFNRTLPVDLAGIPTTVVPQAAEGLDVLYEIRYYPMLGDTIAVVNIEGEDYSCITRASRVTSSFQHSGIGAEIQAINGSNYFAASSQDITSVDQGPTAEDDFSGTPYSTGYQDFTHEREIVANCGIGGWNVPGGVVRSVVCTTPAGQFQTQFDRQSSPTAGFPKTAAQSAELRWTIVWSSWLWDGDWNSSADEVTTGPTFSNWNKNAGGTILRINWEDGDGFDRREELKVPDDTMFHIQDKNDSAKWSEYTMLTATTWTEGTDWTEYSVSPDDGPGGSILPGRICTIRAVSP